jgi:hypothetical protein
MMMEKSGGSNIFYAYLCILCCRPATSSLSKTDSDAEFCQRTAHSKVISLEVGAVTLVEVLKFLM